MSVRQRRLALAWSLYAVTCVVGLAVSIVFLHRPDLLGTTSGAHAGVLAFIQLSAGVLGLATVAIFVVVKRPDHAVGWLLLVLCVGVVANTVALAAGTAGYEHSSSPPVVDQIGLIASNVSAALAGSVMALLIAVFPSGRADSWRRKLAPYAVVLLAVNIVTNLVQPGLEDKNSGWHPNPIASPVAGVALGRVASVTGNLIALAVIAAVVDLVIRALRARGVERQQMKLFAYAVAVSILLALIVVPNDNFPWWGAFMFPVDTNLVAIALGVAVVRYRLYDIDRLFSRTVSYAIIIGLLAGVYLGSILLLTRVLPFHGAAATTTAVLVAVGVFAPLRSKMRSTVDRRFNRSQYDAQLVVRAFSRRLEQNVSLELVVGDLLGAVEQVFQPAHAAVWMPAQSTRVVLSSTTR